VIDILVGGREGGRGLGGLRADYWGILLRLGCWNLGGGQIQFFFEIEFGGKISLSRALVLDSIFL